MTAWTRLPVPATSTVWPCRDTVRTSGSPVRSPSSIGADGRNRRRCSASTRDTIPAGVSRATRRPSSITAMRSARRSASSMKWVTRMTVTPLSRTSSMSCQVSRRACGSRPVVSSSRIAIFGLPMSASATESRCFWPPESLPNLALRLIGEPEVGQQLLPVAGICVERGVEVDRLPDLDLVGQLALLELDADDATELVAVAARVEPEHADRARVGRPQPADGLDRGGLAGAVGAEDGEDLALLDREGHAVDRRAVAVALDEVGDFDDVHGPSVGRSRARGHRPGGWNGRSTRWSRVSTVRLVRRRQETSHGVTTWTRPHQIVDGSGRLPRYPDSEHLDLSHVATGG